MAGYLTFQGKLPKKEGEGQQQQDHTQEVVGYFYFLEMKLLKADVNFELWKFEAECLLKGGVHSEATIADAVRKRERRTCLHGEKTWTRGYCLADGKKTG